MKQEKRTLLSTRSKIRLLRQIQFIEDNAQDAKRLAAANGNAKGENPAAAANGNTQDRKPLARTDGNTKDVKPPVTEL